MINYGNSAKVTSVFIPLESYKIFYENTPINKKVIDDMSKKFYTYIGPSSAWTDGSSMREFDIYLKNKGIYEYYDLRSINIIYDWEGKLMNI